MRTQVNDEFVDGIFELAFGEDAINKEYDPDEVYRRLFQYCEDSYRWEQYCEKNGVDFEDTEASNKLLNRSCDKSGKNEHEKAQ